MQKSAYSDVMYVEFLPELNMVQSIVMEGTCFINLNFSGGETKTYSIDELIKRCK